MATKEAIGKMRQEALNRIEAAMESLTARFEIPALDLASVHYNDPNYQWAARLTALAGWLELLNDALAQSGIDLEGVQETSKQLDTIRVVLDQALNAMTRRDLEVVLADFGLEFRGSIKQEYVNEIVAYLTGKSLETVSLDGLVDEPEDSDSDAEPTDEEPEVE